MTSQTEKTIALGRPGLLSTGPIRWPTLPAAAIAALGLAGLVLFFASLRHVRLSHMNGLGLLSVLPHGAVAGVVILALAFVLGIALPRPHPLGLAAGLVALVICLDGVTTFIEPQPRFPTAFQIAGFIQYISSTGHATPGLAAYFSWPGFFALVSMVTGAAGTHGLLGLMRVWPMLIDLACLPPFFLIMRNLRIPWRAQWVAGFLFTVGNWVGQDYLSPQSFNYVLYLVFLAILVNWFTQPRLSANPHVIVSRLTRLHRRIFGILRPGELAPRSASTGQRAFLLAVLIAIFAVSTMSHQLTPFYLVGAATVLVLVRRSTLPGLPVLFGVILIGWVSFAAVDYWSGHMSNIFGGFGNLGGNLTSSVGGRLMGSTSVHLLTLHAREGVAAVIVGMAILGLLRRRRKGFDDRVLIALFCMPILSIGLQSYGGEMALRIYLFLLPAACILAGCFFFADPKAGRANWRAIPVLALCAAILPVAFILVRYGNDAFEQIPTGEVAASNWIYTHDTQGARIQWLSSSPTIDNTPEMPWSYKDIDKVLYLPVQAPLHPANVSGLVHGLRSSGPGTYLIATRTQETYLEQAAGYPAGWGSRFNQLMRAEPGVRVAFTNSAATVYTVAWPPGAHPRPLPPNGGRGSPTTIVSVLGLVLLFTLIAVLMAREFLRVAQPRATRLIHPLTVASVPLLVLVLGDVVLRFAGVT
jgi:hypothetical protein